MAFTFWHESLSSTLIGLEAQSIVQFRGIPYGKVTHRFADPDSAVHLPTLLDCTKYGPRCPQVPVDFGHLLRIPRDVVHPTEPEDEFKCLNLDVTIPKKYLFKGGRLPVMVWIHGEEDRGELQDMAIIVGDSSRLEKPILAVSIQYRLNIFGVGDEKSSKNLALRDQELALQWVQKHISGFGGDPGQVTLAVSKPRLRQIALSSGSLYLSPPQPQEKVYSLVNNVQGHLQELGRFNLRDASVEQGWQQETGSSQRILLSDCQREFILWQDGIWATVADSIVEAFDRAGHDVCELKWLYHIYLGRSSVCKQGALDFINDYKFVLLIQCLTKLWSKYKKQVYRYLINKPNPCQPSGAHHAVDLLHLFGGFDFSFSRAAYQTGSKMHETWISFVHFKDSQSPRPCVAFGPNGEYQYLDGNI
ncbi:Alpha/Beta hydrolase protein [Ilyonectria destructans]|nr:Alpha/Beta hydrolase protein [Ilyonectria destructans]